MRLSELIGVLPFACLTCLSPDMLVIGFQEIVPLTAQQIVQTDPEKRCADTVLRSHKRII
jgi:hypothetical protein